MVFGRHRRRSVAAAGGFFPHSDERGTGESDCQNGTEIAGIEVEPEVIVVEGETGANPPEGEMPSANGAAAADTTTDPVLLD